MSAKGRLVELMIEQPQPAHHEVRGLGGLVRHVSAGEIVNVTLKFQFHVDEVGGLHGMINDTGAMVQLTRVRVSPEKSIQLPRDPGKSFLAGKSREDLILLGSSADAGSW